MWLKGTVCRVILILCSQSCLLSYKILFFSFLPPPYRPHALFFSVKPREVLMFFTAMTWSTSCSITTLWWPWLLRTSQPTWRPWGSSAKVCSENLKWNPGCFRPLVFISKANVWDLDCLHCDNMCFYRRTSWVWPTDCQTRKSLQPCSGSAGTTKLLEVQHRPLNALINFALIIYRPKIGEQI